MNSFAKVLLTVIAVPLGIVGALLLTPLIALRLLFELPACIIHDIWVGGYGEDDIQ